MNQTNLKIFSSNIKYSSPLQLLLLLYWLVNISTGYIQHLKKEALHNFDNNGAIPYPKAPAVHTLLA